ncbi:hypothetical protein C3731_21250 [Brucella oryzae]|uniref:Uncharacterized protein n=1 Tax=Brucella oryzae TaxID=335286 RepID=A0A2S7IU83_9HYPH|nr:hypothetical protein C3731_21250 [Brucella oryzae]
MISRVLGVIQKFKFIFICRYESEVLTSGLVVVIRKLSYKSYSFRLIVDESDIVNTTDYIRF